jgi:hypothetical protein
MSPCRPVVRVRVRVNPFPHSGYSWSTIAAPAVETFKGIANVVDVLRPERGVVTIVVLVPTT